MAVLRERLSKHVGGLLGYSAVEHRTPRTHSSGLGPDPRKTPALMRSLLLSVLVLATLGGCATAHRPAVAEARPVG
jgi:hypothetical protein